MDELDIVCVLLMVFVASVLFFGIIYVHDNPIIDKLNDELIVKYTLTNKDTFNYSDRLNLSTTLCRNRMSSENLMKSWGYRVGFAEEREKLINKCVVNLMGK